MSLPYSDASSPSAGERGWLRGGGLELALAAVTLFGGCWLSEVRNLDLQGPHFSRDEDNQVLQQARDKDEKATPFGFSSKARDIEGSLGVRE